MLEINDDGPGIPDEVQPKIFDPFFTTKEVGKGTGLGLTVAYAIVQEHGGRIRLESRPDAGASFYVEIPISGGKLPPGPIAGKRFTESPDAVSGASVLVVEDEAALAAAVADALADAGYVVVHASDGEEALARIRTQTFDAVICDLKMPRLDGKAFYRTLSAGTPGLARRVIFVTGDVAGTDAETFLEQSGCRWLAKPFRLGELLRVLAGSADVKLQPRRHENTKNQQVFFVSSCFGGCLYLAAATHLARAGDLDCARQCTGGDRLVRQHDAIERRGPPPGRDLRLHHLRLWRRTSRAEVASPRPVRGFMSPSASRRRRMARACSCETRDSFTPISAPICFMVTSP